MEIHISECSEDFKNKGVSGAGVIFLKIVGVSTKSVTIIFSYNNRKIKSIHFFQEYFKFFFRRKGDEIQYLLLFSELFDELAGDHVIRYLTFQPLPIPIWKISSSSPHKS